VEFAVVAPVVFMFIFGIFEYCRYGFYRNVMENAVREGARFATMTTNSTSANPTYDVQNVVATKLMGVPTAYGVPTWVGVGPAANGGIWMQLGNPVITVAKVNPATGQFEDGSVPAKVVGSAAAPFTNAGFGDGVYVNLSANYLAVIGNFVRMPTSFPIGVTSIMMSEGN
jgi:hypothetical protein